MSINMDEVEELRAEDLSAPIELSDDFDENLLAELADGKPPAEEVEELPSFEGQVVTGVDIKISGLSSVEQYDGGALRVHDRIRLLVEARVTKVTHGVSKDEDGLRREHHAKVISADLVPWNPGDPHAPGADGVLRAE